MGRFESVFEKELEYHNKGNQCQGTGNYYQGVDAQKIIHIVLIMFLTSPLSADIRYLIGH